MSLDFLSRIRMNVAVTSALLVGASGLAPGQQRNDAPAASKKNDAPAASKSDSPRAERVEGVILKVEKFAKAGSDSKPEKDKGEARPGPVSLRLSINTNAVWRDWARDQARAIDEGSPGKDAAQGANSVATKGQPADQNSLVVVEVEPGTRVETRFRSPSDETSKGVTEPEKVRPDGSTAAGAKPAGKPVRFRAEDLSPGLFVEAEFRSSGPRDKNTASIVTVIRPISVLDASPAARPAPK